MSIANEKVLKYKIRAKKLFDPTSREPFELSRTKLEDFISCPRCFYMDRRLGAGKPDTPPFQLNKAVDELLKKEFDLYRKKGEPHPLMKQYGIDAVPFSHVDLNKWRHNFSGVRYIEPTTNFLVYGSIDDVWQKPNGDLIVLDYKATWKNEEKEKYLEDEWRQSWKRQLEVYQWLFRKNGFQVSATGYFLYCNVDADEPAFQGQLKFKLDIWSYVGDVSWIVPTLIRARECLSLDRIPEPDPTCDYCAYRKASANLAAKHG